MRNYPATILLLCLSMASPVWAQKGQPTYDHVGTVQYMAPLEPSVTVLSNHGDAYCYSGDGSVDCYSGLPTGVTIVTLEKETPYTIDGQLQTTMVPYLNDKNGKLNPLSDAVMLAINSRPAITKHYDNPDEAAAAFKERQEQPMTAHFQYRLVKDYKAGSLVFKVFKSYYNSDKMGFCMPYTVKDKRGNVKKQTEVCYPL
jgi:hypothetical protein